MMRFGVMCSGKVFQRWQADAILELKRHGHQPVLLIVNGRETQSAGFFARLFKKRWSTILFTILENRFFAPQSKQQFSLEDELTGIEILSCRVEQKGYSEYFSADNIAEIKGYKLDFILRFGFNILRGEILESAKHGIWSFHHGDEEKYRGGPAGFWEIYHNDSVNGAILQRLTSKLDGGIILRKGFFSTVGHSWSGNIEQLLTATSSWPALVANELARFETGEEPVNLMISKTIAKIFKVPGNVQMLLFLATLLRNRIRFYCREFIFAEQWNVGIVSKPITEVALGKSKLQQDDVKWFKPMPLAEYIADPFGFMVGGDLHVVAEHFNYATMRGTLTGWGDPVRVEGPPNHLSYPYIVEYHGEIYCIPESCQSGKITLYRYNLAEMKLTTERVLLDNIQAVDPTLVFFNGFWWLFLTSRIYSNTHLYLFFSENLDGEFKAHPQNPVKIDIRSARPAGTPFVHQGHLYRPAQDCSKTYGGRVMVNKVNVITTDQFSEEVVNAVEPDETGYYRDGLHTISMAGDITLVDGKRYRANWHYFVSQLRNRLKFNQQRYV